MIEETLQEFVEYCKANIKGDEKGEAHIFLDHFFMALGYKDGLKGAGADLEFRVKKSAKVTSFADLVWPKRVLIEMKKSGEKLDMHLQQATSYWLKLAGNRSRYVILCNFDEFWIYDFDKDPSEPADVVKLENLPKRQASFSFLLEKPQTPVFGTNREEVTEKAAYFVATVFQSMQNRGVEREVAMQNSLQYVLVMFAEDVNLLPDNIFTRVLSECLEEGLDHPRDMSAKSFDLIGQLFREMNTKGITKGGRFKDVEYFNGGLFQEIIPVELTKYEVEMLAIAAKKDWSKVNPAIFGSFFEAGMDKGERHVYGAHYTYEIDIKKIVDPVIVQPWKKAIERALKANDPLEEYYKLIEELRNFKVLDPACGSGNFLFVAYREMKMLEKELLALIKENSQKEEDDIRLQKFLKSNKYVSIKQFYGMDVKKYAVEVAKVTLMVAKELWVTEHAEVFDNEEALPLENLDENINCVDALLNEEGSQKEWPETDAIIGNPPYQSKNKMKKEFGVEYVNMIRSAYPEVPGRADFCVYWFYKAHKQLKEGGRAGLVGTNTIRQNYSREGSLDYIVKNGGVIYNAISTQVWSGEAVVHVSLVNWKKGEFKGKPYLFYPNEKGELELKEVDVINSSLSPNIDVSNAKVLLCNKKPKCVFQGQTHGHEGFILDKKEGLRLLKENKKHERVIKPFLIGDAMVSNIGSQPDRFVIDFTEFDMNGAASYKKPFEIIIEKVLPDRKKKAEEQTEENKKAREKDENAKVNKHHINFYNSWWKLSYGRAEMLELISGLKRIISVPQVSSRPIFEFISTEIRPNAALMVFPFEDDYSFGIIQSAVHIEWYEAKCSTMKGDPRYTTTSIWDTFPWPQKPNQQQVEKVGMIAKALRDARNKTMKDYNMTLRDLYSLLDRPGKNPIRDRHTELDKVVMEAYGFDEKKNLLSQLLELNIKVATNELEEEPVQGPGLPEWVMEKEKLISDDFVRFEI